MNMKVLLIKQISTCFQHIFQHIDQNAKIIRHIHFFLKMLRDKTSSLRKVRKSYILKFKHIELTINGDIYSKILEQCTWKS